MKRILIILTAGVVVGLILGVMLGRKLRPSDEQVVDHISHLSFPELSAFNKKLNAQAGLQVYQSQMLPTATPMGGGVPK